MSLIFHQAQEEMSVSVQQQARAFMRANDASPVIAGEVIGNGGQGGRYTLKDGRVFTLPLEVARAVPEPYPKWDL